MDLHIAFSSDNNYVAHLGVAIISLLENNRGFKKICRWRQQRIDGFRNSAIQYP